MVVAEKSLPFANNDFSHRCYISAPLYFISAYTLVIRRTSLFLIDQS